MRFTFITASLVALVAATGANAQDFNASVRSGSTSCQEAHRSPNTYGRDNDPTMELYTEVEQNFEGDDKVMFGAKIVIPLGKKRKYAPVSSLTVCGDVLRNGILSQGNDLRAQRLDNLEQELKIAKLEEELRMMKIRNAQSLEPAPVAPPAVKEIPAGLLNNDW